jgi:hypothetical protein
LLNGGTYFPAVIPEIVTTDVTIRRAQHFKNFSLNTKLCWLNFYHGELIQSGTISQQYDDTVAMPVTVPKVKVYPDGNILRVVRCDSLQPTGMLFPVKFYEEGLNNSLVMSNEFLAFSSTNQLSSTCTICANLLGEEVELQQHKNEFPEKFSSELNLLPAGIYFFEHEEPWEQFVYQAD